MVKRTENNKKSPFKANNTRFMAAKASKEKGGGSSFTKSAASTNPNRPDPAGGKKGSQFRTKSTINRINMYKAKPDMAKMKMKPTNADAGRIHPDRRWFGNVRTVD